MFARITGFIAMAAFSSLSISAPEIETLGAVEAKIFPVKVTLPSLPTHPNAGRQSEFTGTVLVRVQLDKSGKVLAVKVAETSGFRALDRAAVSTIRRTRFTVLEPSFSLAEVSIPVHYGINESVHPSY
jgi:TonB family protein